MRLSSFLAALLLLPLLVCCYSVQAQLPAGTTDTTAEQPPDPLYAQATEALSKRDYPAALKLLQALAGKNPNDAKILYDLGLAQDALDQTSAAEASYRQASEAEPNFLEPHLALGLLLARAGKADEAHAELSAAAAIANGDPELRAHAYRALARLDQQQNPAAASQELLEALKLSPETPDDTLLSAELAEASGDAAAAEATYRRLLAADPGNPDVSASLVHLLLQQNKTDQALATLTAALEKHPDDPLAPSLQVQLARIYIAQNQPEKALSTVESLHGKNPEDTNLTRLLARLYSQTGNYDKAEPLYAALLAAAPSDLMLADDRADALIHLQRYAEAETLLKALIANPGAFRNKEDLGQVASHLAYAASANNDPATTLSALAVRATVLPPSPAALFLAATAHDKLHQRKQASELYRQFLSEAKGQFPNEEWEARHRLIALENTK